MSEKKVNRFIKERCIFCRYKKIEGITICCLRKKGVELEITDAVINICTVNQWFWREDES